jgi:hypothetical protein
MKYVLVDKGDNIIDTVDLASDVGLTGAKTFFIGRKQIPYENFVQIWKVMTKDEYDRLLDLSYRQNKQYEWWKEDKEITDSELKF